MSDHIPSEIQIEIMKRLPVKSLLQFRSVSKPWNSLIDSSHFVTAYSRCQTDQHMFIMYEPFSYVSIIDDDDNFSQLKFDTVATVPESVKQLIEPTLLGSSQGLLCFYDDSHAVIWNPSIRTSVDITVPNVVLTYMYHTVVGFGVCLKTNDPKLVKITFPMRRLEMETWQVEVFSLSSGCWRSRSFSKISNLLCTSFELTFFHECLDGFIYWYACEKEGVFCVIVLFDLTNEEFGVIYLPDSLARSINLGMSKHRQSLILLRYYYFADEGGCDVWMMEGGVTKSFKKLFTINASYACMTILAFRNNGKPIMELQDDSKIEFTELEVYDPSSKQFTDIGICGLYGSFFVSSYMETLLLNDQVPRFIRL